MTSGSPRDSTESLRPESDLRDLVRRPPGGVRPCEDPPERIGAYRILEFLGEGGMGTVYLAEQTTPVHRRVALKITKLGLDTRAVIARFETEREALALMNHPNVARVFDAGATDSGRPYFVMEHVAGIPITEYCDKHRLTTDERLSLFIDVCTAIQHAHQKGVIHRDLKPSNILVAVQDDKPVPKVIDFGVAKATQQRLTEHTVFTEQGQLIGTPGYMSPEQAEMSALDVDTRTDIYSLGIILYELLVGTLPLETGPLLQRGLAEIQLIIREVEPLKPSTRLSGLGAHSATVAQKRRTDVRALTRKIRGDLDWIVMKCLEKDRTRRYDSASGLAAEIERFLRNEPVSAGPPSASYRVRKFVRRNRAEVVAAVAVVVSLTAGLIGTSAMYFRAQREAIRAGQAELDAMRQAYELEQVAEFQASQLSGLDPALLGVRLRSALIARRRDAGAEQGLGTDQIDIGVRTFEASIAGLNFTSVALQMLDENILSRALTAIDTEFNQQPLVKARLLQTTAQTLRELGLLEQAALPQTEALDIRLRHLGADHVDTLKSMNDLCVLWMDHARTSDAEPLCRAALAGLRRVLGNDHPETLKAINNLGILLKSQGFLPEAGGLIREALDRRRHVLGSDHPHTLLSIANMGIQVRAEGDTAGAEPYYREALERSRRVLGDDNPQTLSAIYAMGVLMKADGRLSDAERYFGEALERRRRVLGDDHPATLMSTSNMALVLQALGKSEEAGPLFVQAMEGRRRILGDGHPDTVIAINNLGALRFDQGRPAEAEPYHREVLERRRRALGDDHPGTLRSMCNLGETLAKLDRDAEALALFAEASSGYRRALPAGDWRTQVAGIGQGGSLVRLGRHAEAQDLLVPLWEAIADRDEVPRFRKVQCLEALVALSDALDAAEPGRHGSAAANYRQYIAELSNDASEPSPSPPP